MVCLLNKELSMGSNFLKGISFNDRNSVIMKALLFSAIFFIFLSVPAQTTQQTAPYQLGDAIRNFTLLNVANHEQISLENYMIFVNLITFNISLNSFVPREIQT